jgi:hypothetical protein
MPVLQSLPEYRVFLSSPGDVADERGLARQVVQELSAEPFLRGRVRVSTVSWDDPAAPTPMLANLTPQAALERGLPKPSECDFVVVVLWSRAWARRCSRRSTASRLVSPISPAPNGNLRRHSGQGVGLTSSCIGVPSRPRSASMIRSATRKLRSGSASPSFSTASETPMARCGAASPSTTRRAPSRSASRATSAS